MRKHLGKTRTQIQMLLVAIVVIGVTARVQSEGSSTSDDPTEGAHYVGAASCKKCHFKQHRTWKKNTTYKHAGAFETLKPYLKDPGRKDDHGRLCLSCHVTGHGQADRSGFESVEKSAHLLGVQCESCHGPGSNHVKAGQKLKEEKRKTFNPGEKTYNIRHISACADCHNPHQPHAKLAD